VLHGNRTYVLCDDDGQIIETHSISPGSTTLASAPSTRSSRTADVPSYVGVTDAEALPPSICWPAPKASCRRWNPSHAIAQAIKLARDLPKDALVLCNLSGRGDKDVHTIAGARALRCEQSHRETLLPNCAARRRKR
jgi:tryptophan synthase beta chain